MWKTPVSRLRTIAIAEAISYLLLLCVAMPLKYWAGMPEAVKYTGWAHGVLFISFCIALALAILPARLPLIFSGVVFLSSLIPFGPFLIDRRLRAYDRPPAPAPRSREKVAG